MPAPTPDWNLVELRWRGVLLDGSPAKGKITVTASVPRFLDDDPTTPVAIFGNKIVQTLNAQGEATFSVPATDDPDITPNGFTYEISEELNGVSGSRYSIEVPLSSAASGIELNRVVPVEPSPGVPVSIVTRDEFDALKKKAAPVPVTTEAVLANRAAILGGTLSSDVPTIVAPAASNPTLFNQAYAITANAKPADWPVDMGEDDGVTVGFASNYIYQNAPHQFGVTSWRFMMDGAALCVYANAGTTSRAYDMYVDGRPIAAQDATLFAANASFTTWTFSTAKPRLIEIRTSASLLAIYTSKPYRIWKPTTKRYPTGLVVGDSFVLPNVQGSTNQSLNGIYQRIAPLLGLDYVLDDGIGSTGYIADAAGASLPYIGRISKVAAVNPDLLVVHGGGANDFYYGNSVAATTTAVVDYFTEARDLLPDAKLVFVEGFAPPHASYSGRNPDYIALRQAAQAALEDVGVYYVDVATTSPWIAGTGYVGATTGVGNSDVYVGADAIHLTAAGHRYVRERMAPILRRVLADDGSLVNSLISH